MDRQRNLILPGSNDLSWQDRSRCRDSDPGAWQPAPWQDTEGPRLICSMCPVMAECLGYALDGASRWGKWDWGIWGGTTVPGRAELRSELEPAARRLREALADPRMRGASRRHALAEYRRARTRVVRAGVEQVRIWADDVLSARAAQEPPREQLAS